MRILHRRSRVMPAVGILCVALAVPNTVRAEDPCTAPCSYLIGRGAIRVTRVGAAPADDPAASVSWHGDFEHFGGDGADHATVEVTIGGGGAGFDGVLGGSYELGYRHALSQGHALVARLGGAALLQGNDLIRFSMLEVPRVTGAWQYLRGGLLLEAGARGGAMLAGSYGAGEGDGRPLRGLAWGGYVSARGLDYFHIDADVMRIEPTRVEPKARLTRGRASVCIGRRGKQEFFGIGLCLDATVFRGAPGPRAADPAREHTSSILGVSWLGPLVTGRMPESEP